MADTWSKRDIMGLYMALKQGIGWERELLQEHSETIINLVYKIGTPRREPQPIDWEEVGALMEKISLAAHDHYFTPGRTKEYIIKEFSGDITKKMDGDQVLNDMLKKPPKPIFNEVEKALFDFPYPWIAEKAEAAGIDAELLQYAFNICDNTSIYYLQELAQAAHNSLTGTSKSRLECLGEYAEALINALIKNIKYMPRNYYRSTAKTYTDRLISPTTEAFKNMLMSIKPEEGKAYIDTIPGDVAKLAIEAIKEGEKANKIFFQKNEFFADNKECGTREKIYKIIPSEDKREDLSNYNMGLLSRIYTIFTENILNSPTADEFLNAVNSVIEININDLISNEGAGNRERGAHKADIEKLNADLLQFDILWGFMPAQRGGHNLIKLISLDAFNADTGKVRLTAPFLQVACYANKYEIYGFIDKKEDGSYKPGNMNLLKKSFTTCRDKTAAELVYILCLQVIDAGSVPDQTGYKTVKLSLEAAALKSPMFRELTTQENNLALRKFLTRLPETLESYFDKHTAVKEEYKAFTCKINVDGGNVGETNQRGKKITLTPTNWEKAVIIIRHRGTTAANRKKIQTMKKKAQDKAIKKQYERIAESKIQNAATGAENGEN